MGNLLTCIESDPEREKRDELLRMPLESDHHDNVSIVTPSTAQSVKSSQSYTPPTLDHNADTCDMGLLGCVHNNSDLRSEISKHAETNDRSQHLIASNSKVTSTRNAYESPVNASNTLVSKRSLPKIEQPVNVEQISAKSNEGVMVTASEPTFRKIDAPNQPVVVDKGLNNYSSETLRNVVKPLEEVPSSKSEESSEVEQSGKAIKQSSQNIPSVENSNSTAQSVEIEVLPSTNTTVTTVDPETVYKDDEDDGTEGIAANATQKSGKKKKNKKKK